MALIPWKSKEEASSPVMPMERSMMRLRDEMDSLFERFMGDRWGFGGFDSPERTSWPETLRADLAESDDEVAVTVEAPGVEPKELDISVTGQVLTIRGEKRQDREEKKRNYHYVERRFGSFQRNIPLPVGVDADSVDATFHNGVVTIRMAKRPDAKPKRIPVKTE